MSTEDSVVKIPNCILEKLYFHTFEVSNII